VCLFSCGGPATPANDGVTVASADAGAQVVTPTRLPRQKLGVPRDAALVVTADLSPLLQMAPLTAGIARELDLQGDLKQAVGLDTSRSAVLVIAAPDDAMNAVIDELRPLSASNTGSPQTADVCKKVLALKRASYVRLLLPTSNAEALEHAVGLLLEKEDGWHHVRDGFTKGSQAIAVSDDDAYVAFDLGSGAPKAMTGAAEPPPAFDAQRLRAKWTIKTLAGFGFFEGVERACLAVSGDGVDASQRSRIMAEGLFEGGRIFSLTTFDEISADLTLAPLALTFRAKPGTSFTMPGQAAFAPSLSASLSDAELMMASNTALTNAWPLPGGDYRTFKHTVRDAGFWGIMVGLPHLAALMTTAAVDDTTDPITGDPNIGKHFDRVEVAVMKEGTVVVGILPAGTSRSAAECSLDVTPKCAAKVHLRAGTTVRRVMPSGSDRFEKLVEVKVTGEASPRFVVLVSAQETALATKVTSGMASGLHVDFETRPFTRLIGNVLPLPARVSGDVSLDGGQIVMKLGPGLP
jgi:hypothetical protein